METLVYWYITTRMSQLLDHYQYIMKSLNKTTEPATKARGEYVGDLSKLFDIAPPEVESKMRKDRLLGKKQCEEYLSFL